LQPAPFLSVCATAYEAKKQYDEAKKDLDRAGELVPDDKLVQNLMRRIQALIKRDQEKEKKMWSKAFAS
jgi:heat shock 70kDa protein 4